jgi:hypothetical protein
MVEKVIPVDEYRELNINYDHQGKTTIFKLKIEASLQYVKYSRTGKFVVFYGSGGYEL